MIEFGVELPTSLYMGSVSEENLLCSGIYTSRDGGQTVNMVGLELGASGKKANLTLEEASEMLEVALGENDVDYGQENAVLLITEYTVNDLFEESVSPEDAAYSATLFSN